MEQDNDSDIVSHLDSLDFDNEFDRSPVWRFPAESSEHTLTELRDLSARYAYVLRSLGVVAQDRVAVVLPNGPEYVALLLAIWRLNATAVSLALRARRPSDSIEHLRRVAEVCGFKLLVHGADWPEGGDEALLKLGCRTLELAKLSGIPAEGPTVRRTLIASSDIAVLQLSSGSTGEPKAVIVTHGMVRAQLHGIHANHVENISSTASWLPLNHDMGLFIGVLHPIFEASDHVLAPPSFYIRNPAGWFRLLSEYRVDFAFTTNSVLASSLKSLARLDEGRPVDLSQLHLYVAAEKVSAKVVRSAVEVLAPFGMRRKAFRVGYGMAENALGCCCTQRRAIASHHFEIDEHDRIRVASAPSDRTNELVAVGEPYFDQRVTVCDEQGAPLPELFLGEIHVEGPCLTPGYYRDPEATARSLASGRLRTGDLGFFYDGELYFYARKDDLIVSGGRNIVPDDVEHAVEKLDFVRPAGACLFAVESDRGTTELVLLVEPRAARLEDAELMRARIRAEVYRTEGVLVNHIVLCAKRAVEKTTSGKKRRRVLRARYQANQLETLGADRVDQAVV